MKTVGSAKTEQSKPVVSSRVGYWAESGESEAVRKVEESIAHMMRHLDKPLQAATLAARVNVSPSHFFTLFKRHAGCTPIDYFIRLRMQHACRLLDATEMSVKAIAITLGYDDLLYFSRIFKSVNQVAPSEYRLLKNGAKEAVKSCGITLRFFSVCDARVDFERKRNGGGATSNGEAGRSRWGLNAVMLSGGSTGAKS